MISPINPARQKVIPTNIVSSSVMWLLFGCGIIALSLIQMNQLERYGEWRKETKTEARPTMLL